MKTMELHVSGSLGDIKEELEEMLAQLWLDENMNLSTPPCRLNYSDAKIPKVWLFNVNHKSFMPYPKAAEVQPLESFDKSGEDALVPCMLGYDLVLVPVRNITETGWN